MKEKTLFVNVREIGWNKYNIFLIYDMEYVQ